MPKFLDVPQWYDSNGETIVASSVYYHRVSFNCNVYNRYIWTIESSGASEETEQDSVFLYTSLPSLSRVPFTSYSEFVNSVFTSGTTTSVTIPVRIIYNGNSDSGFGVLQRGGGSSSYPSLFGVAGYGSSSSLRLQFFNGDSMDNGWVTNFRDTIYVVE